MSNITDIQPGTQVRITTDQAEPWIERGDVLTVINPDEHWDALVEELGAQEAADLIGPLPAWPADAIAVDHPMSALMGPAAFRDGEFEVVQEQAA